MSVARASIDAWMIYSRVLYDVILADFRSAIPYSNLLASLIHTRTNIHTYIHTHTYTYTYIHINTNTHTHTHTHTYTNTH